MKSLKKWPVQYEYLLSYSGLPVFLEKYKKYLSRPYLLRKVILLRIGSFSYNVYNSIMFLIEWIIQFFAILLTNIINSASKPHRNRPLVLFCGYKYYTENPQLENAEVVLLVDTLRYLDVESDVFFWDTEKKLVGNQFSFYKKVIKSSPDLVILSSYSTNMFTHPSISVLKKIKNRISVQYVSLIWDSCSEGFIDSIRSMIPTIDFFMINDNPVKNINNDSLTEKERKKFIFSTAAANPNYFVPANRKNIDVAFFGQVGSYRSLRREYIVYLMNNNISGFISTFNKDSWCTYKEYSQVLSISKIGINFSYSVDRDQLKGRVFEIMMSGALLLESANEQIACYFEDGVDYVSFTTKEDLLDKIHYFLEHPDERLKIAENGRNKCIEKYTPQIFFDNILKITELKEGI